MIRMSKRTQPTDEPVAKQPPLWRLRARDVIFGSIMLVGGLFLLVSLLTYNPLDPSWNVASANEVRNFMGSFGAGLADLSLQLVGWSAGFPAIACILWGGIMIWRMPRHRSHSMAPSRWFFAIIGTLGLGMCLSALPIPATWPLPDRSGRFAR